MVHVSTHNSSSHTCTDVYCIPPSLSCRIQQSHQYHFLCLMPSVWIEVAWWETIPPCMTYFWWLCDQGQSSQIQGALHLIKLQSQNLTGSCYHTKKLTANMHWCILYPTLTISQKPTQTPVSLPLSVAIFLKYRSLVNNYPPCMFHFWWLCDQGQSSNNQEELHLTKPQSQNCTGFM